MQTAQNDLFTTVPPTKHMPFYSNGKTDLRKVADFFEFSNEDIAKISEVSKSSVRFSGARVPQSMKLA